MDADLAGLIEQGHSFLLNKDFVSAEACFNRAVALNGMCSMAHNNLGWTYEHLGNSQSAMNSYQRALELDPNLTLAKVNLASLMTKSGQEQGALPLWHDLVEEGLFDRQSLNEAIDAALNVGAIHQAARWAQICGAVTRGAPLYAPEVKPICRDELAPAMLKLETLTHDIEQIEYLRRSSGKPNIDFESMLINYKLVRDALLISGDRGRRALDDKEQRLIGDTYGRIWHIRKSSETISAPLWGDWNPSDVERAYSNSPLGLCVVDNFLSDEVLTELQNFCLESTVWLANHYSHGRLGAFFREGFVSPLLLKLADQFPRLFPNLIGDRHRLLQIWGFKYSAFQPNTNPHADFAAVNLNFWITPDDANLDRKSGGLVVYDLEAPLSWSHNSYNKNGPEIAAFLRQNGARAIYIPYRANRAVFFNSDLFHATAPLSFRNEYRSRRINITMLYGRRANDTKRPPRSPN
ncbi:tetratricopeptide repeat protein [Bradyrhizobium sp. CCGUVB14]|uniref:tetratricopeptide repeat protein n=1 Tax=Bradyrhizobium sp. CCGUVB14 TaxID=2949628 RepID=UPI0020B2EF89|nr:tetratricopeptide repeat protein [Bradyrhizobium sp. CCGUVB14]MCP3442008.1 tetratricopeptide repeat protein [Bradyrhizobium sp. CCGUVB14]